MSLSVFSLQTGGGGGGDGAIEDTEVLGTIWHMSSKGL